MGYISKMIDTFLEKGYKRFFMPGHKGKTGYPRDLTEVDMLDDLLNQRGAIKFANEKIAKIYNMDFCTLSTCGSTLCIMAMLLCHRSKVLIGRDAHKSAINALTVFNIDYEFVKDTTTKGYIAALNTTTAKTLYITYPGYDSKIIEYSEIIKVAKSKGMLIIGDFAHGAHFPFSNRFPDIYGADMFCVSVHKTMGALTGGALVFSNNESKKILKANFSKLHSTSPNFLIMESVENAIDYFNENSDIIDKWIDECEIVKNKIKDYVTLEKTLDTTRFVVSKAGYTGYELFELYKSHGIMPEMADDSKVVFLTSPLDIDSIKLLTNVKPKERNGIKKDLEIVFGQKHKAIAYVIDKEFELLHYKDCNERISYLPLGAYPPGIAAVMPGEIINSEVIEYFEKILNHNGKIFNMENEMIQVVKK